MSLHNNCGVELVEENGQLTVTMFKPSSLAPKKFETIILNGNDPTYTNGRVKAKVSCSMDENSVVYITKVPVLTDGMKTPYAIEKLTIRQDEKGLKVTLRAGLTPIHSVYRSITDCML
ncbi:MAG TPA: hypothetical protein VNJ08_09660 [Bacteriovoracaceae bacterium]|nr:hypothetical protein [Bacteriovoracaceae bacterium]